jgi:hypothetical protein
MSFWKRLRESEVERELRARRPKPPDELVDHISTMVSASKRPSRGRIAPKVVLIAAVTAVMAASLGVAGALGYAGGSVHSFSSNVVHLVTPSHQDGGYTRGAGFTRGQPNGGSNSGPGSSSGQGSGNNGNNGSQGDPQHSQGGGDPNGGWGRDPFKHQYGGRWPICWHGHRLNVTFFEFIWYGTHGGRPWYTCSP